MALSQGLHSITEQFGNKAPPAEEDETTLIYTAVWHLCHIKWHAFVIGWCLLSSLWGKMVTLFFHHSLFLLGPVSDLSEREKVEMSQESMKLQMSGPIKVLSFNSMCLVWLVEFIQPKMILCGCTLPFPDCIFYIETMCACLCVCVRLTFNHFIYSLLLNHRRHGPHTLTSVDLRRMNTRPCWAVWKHHKNHYTINTNDHS